MANTDKFSIEERIAIPSAANELPVPVRAATRSLLLFFSLSSFLDAEKMAARLAAAIWYIFVSDDDDVVSKLEYDDHTNLREDYAAARYILSNPCMQMITYVHTYRGRLPASGNGVVTGNHRRSAAGDQISSCLSNRRQMIPRFLRRVFHSLKLILNSDVKFFSLCVMSTSRSNFQ